MKDEDKTKEQFLKELSKLRQRIAELETLKTEHIGIEKALRESEAKYRPLVESTEDSIYLVDKDYRYLFVNRKHLSRLEISKDEMTGKAYSEFHSPEETKEFVEKVKRVFETGESAQHEHRSKRDNKYFLRTLSPVKSRDGKIIAVSVISKDINELKRMEDELRVLSLTDELTGLYNRRGFLTLAEQQLKMAKRLKKGVFILYADLDDLKVINDSFGHKEGDQALMEIANILKATYRDSDIIARIGGDEFAVFPVVVTETAADPITARLKENIDIYNSQGIRSYMLSLSVGISHFDPKSHYSVHDLLAQVDRLMYEQKRQKQRP